MKIDLFYYFVFFFFKKNRRSQAVAIKQVSFVSMHDEQALRNFFVELSLMKKIRPHGK